MAVKTERRTFAGTELRALSNMEISGIAAAYGVLSHDLGGFKEIISPGAFSRSLREGADVKATFNHDPSIILGRTKSGTLQLSDSPQGLRWVAQLDKGSQQHNDIYRAIKRGDVSDCSFAFTCPAGGDDFSDSGDVDENGRSIKRRCLRDVNLMDVSAVTYPAYPTGTGVDARSVSALLAPDYVLRRTVVLTDEQRRAKAARLGKLIELDKEVWSAAERARAESLRELARRMESAAGISYGRKY